VAENVMHHVLSTKYKKVEIRGRVQGEAELRPMSDYRAIYGFEIPLLATPPGKCNRISLH